MARWRNSWRTDRRLSAVSTSFLPYGRHAIDDDDVAAVTRVLRGDFLTTGPAVDAFEDKLAGITGAQFAISCSSGTAALHLATLAIGLGPGDLAVVPTVTFLATANAVRYVGADVVFCDVDPDTGLMRPQDLEQAIVEHGQAIKAVLPVHLAGQSPDMKGIGELARKHGIAVIEDACHALGTLYPASGGAAPVGSCRDSDMAVFSFHPVKVIAMGEGGAITTNEPALAARLNELRSHGMTRDAARFTNNDLALAKDGTANPWHYEMQELGFNYRASDIHCALGLSQLAKLDEFVERRRLLVSRYDALLAPLSPLVRPLGRTPGCLPSWHLYVALIDFDAAGVTRGELMERLKENGVGTQVHYIPVHTQPYYQGLYGAKELPGAAAYYARCLSLPLFAAMDDEDPDRVVKALTLELGI